MRGSRQYSTPDASSMEFIDGKLYSRISSLVIPVSRLAISLIFASFLTAAAADIIYYSIKSKDPAFVDKFFKIIPLIAIYCIH